MSRIRPTEKGRACRNAITEGRNDTESNARSNTEQNSVVNIHKKFGIQTQTGTGTDPGRENLLIQNLSQGQAEVIILEVGRTSERSRGEHGLFIQSAVFSRDLSMVLEVAGILFFMPV